MTCSFFFCFFFVCFVFQNWPPIENVVTISCDKCQPYGTIRTHDSSLLNKAACSNDNVEETSKDICDSEISTSGLSIWLNQEDLVENVRNNYFLFMIQTCFIYYVNQF